MVKLPRSKDEVVVGRSARVMTVAAMANLPRENDCGSAGAGRELR